MAALRHTKKRLKQWLFPKGRSLRSTVQSTIQAAVQSAVQSTTQSTGQQWLPPLSGVVWILTLGRVLLHLGTGLVMFYGAIYFVEQVGLSATAVGTALGLGQLSGVLGRVASGSWSDSPRVGRRNVLLLSAVASALGDGVLGFAAGFPLLIVGNLLMGLGVGLYWPAMEALVADFTPEEHRREAFAVTRLADVVGLGLGTAIGGLLVGQTGLYRLLFLGDALSFVLFAVAVVALVPDRRPAVQTAIGHWAGWRKTLSDRLLGLFVIANILFTTYLAQVEATLPLYLKRIVGLAPAQIGVLFSGHIILAAVTQLPMSRLLRPYGHARSLAIAAGLFGAGFVAVWWIQPGAWALAGAIGALALLSLAMVAYTPSGSALVVDLAPESLRGTYLSINSLCWAVGYAVGPPLGGLALDATPAIARGFWIWPVLSVGLVLGLLHWLDRLLDRHLNRASST
ncbi:MDR family MFS transporter [Limnothrix redekei]|uniref:MFS transporter n=1 Tax=Limnothrix redekei LRLZ20PSL1 TaxID=3112953 RepID=A0ABW7C5D6_9CYAN